MKHWKLWTLTCAVILLSLLVVIFVDSDKTSALGSIFAASSGFVAVIWFYNSLELQSVQLQEQQKQLEEQRVQFQLEFNNIRLEAKRSALLVAREILNDMENRVQSSLNGIGTINNLHVLFLNGLFSHINTITNEDNPKIVLDEIEKFAKVFGPARTFLYSFKEAATIILENENIPVTDDKDQPEWFVVIYEKYLQNRPFISKFLPNAQLLSMVMTSIKLEIITLASFAAMGLLNPNGLKDEAIQDMINFRNKDAKVTPKIVEKYLTSLSSEQKKKFGI